MIKKDFEKKKKKHSKSGVEKNDVSLFMELLFVQKITR